MNETFTVIFIARKVKNNEEKSLIYSRLTLNKERREFGLRIRIKSKAWEPKAQKVIGKNEETKTINVQLELIANKYKRIFNEIKFNKGAVDLDEIISRIHIDDKEFALENGLLPRNLATGKMSSQFANLAREAGISDKIFQSIKTLMITQSAQVEKMIEASFLNDSIKRNYLQSYQRRMNLFIKE